MIEILNRSDSLRAGRLHQDDVQFLTSDGLRWRMVSRPHVWRPPTDVYETETAIIVRVEIAGVSDSDFEISLDGKYLSVGGTRADVPERRAYYQMEIPFGEFNTEIELPGLVAADKIEAEYRDGFLKINLPKLQPQQIRITD